MNCQQVQDQLALWATDDVTASERVRIEAHLAVCPVCHEMAEAYRESVVDLGQAIVPTVVSLQHVRSIQSVCAAEIRFQRRQEWQRRALCCGTALAAAMVLGVVAGYFIYGLGGRSGGFDPAVERWRYEGTPSQRTSSAEGVVVRGDRLYAVRRGESAGAVVAIDAVAGRPLWEAPIARPGYLAVDAERVYCVASGKGGLQLVALDADDGRPAWRYADRSGAVRLRPSRPVSLSGGRVAWTVGGSVHLLDAATGAAVWRRSLPGEGLLSRVAAADDDILVAGCRTLYGLDPASGEERWRRPFEEAMAPVLQPLLVVSGGRTYVAGAGGGQGGRLVCLDRLSGNTLWTCRVPQPRHLLATADRVYVRCTAIWALDYASGRRVWTCSADGCGPLTCENGLVRFVDSGRDGSLVALDQETGRKAWEVPGVQSCCAVATAGDTGYVKTWDGAVRAIALRTR